MDSLNSFSFVSSGVCVPLIWSNIPLIHVRRLMDSLNSWVYPRRCKTSSVDQSADCQSRGRRFDSSKPPKKTLYIRHETFIHETWLVYTWETWLIYTSDMTYVCFHMWDMTHVSYMNESCLIIYSSDMTHVSYLNESCLIIDTADMTHASYINESCLIICTSDMTHVDTDTDTHRHTHTHKDSACLMRLIVIS